MQAAHFILFTSNQDASTSFYLLDLDGHVLPFAQINNGP